MSERKTKQGYDFVIKGFIEFDPSYLFNSVDEAAHDPVAAKKEIEEVLAKHGFEAVTIVPKHRKRKTL